MHCKYNPGKSLQAGRKVLLFLLLLVFSGQLGQAFELRVGQAWTIDGLHDPQHQLRYEAHYHRSYILGLGFDLARLSPSTGLAANLYFIQKGIGGEFIIRGRLGDDSLERNYVQGYGNYLSLSMPLKIESRQRYWGIYALLGPRLDYQISRHTIPLGISPTITEQTVYADGFQRFDPGLDYGLGLMLDFFTIEYRFSQNLSTSFKSELIRITNYAHQLNFVFTLPGG